MRISQYLDPQYFGKAWRNCMYMMSHNWTHHSPLRSEYTGREPTREHQYTTLLWKVNTWKYGNSLTPYFADYKQLQAKKSEYASCNFSASWHRGPASWHQEKIWFRQWVPCTVTYSRGGHNWKCGIKNMTTLRSQMHKSWVCRRWSPAGYLSQVKSQWDQCPASSSPAHISSPDK
jgi:hypothetical protein